MTAHFAPPPVRSEAGAIVRALGSSAALADTGGLRVHSPITGEAIALLAPTTAEQAEQTISAAQAAFGQWRSVPAPRRGELVRLLGNELRSAKRDLGRLVTLETGKILSEGEGEVQEMIDICDFALGLSRQLYGLAAVSERAEHRLMEQWHPIGPVGVISAFNFPVAVWSWNAALALVCGNPVIWKPSDRTPLTALAVDALLARAMAKFGDAPDGLHAVLIGGREISQQLVDDRRVPVVSATGSTAMGRVVGERLARRFARAILELGGNNAAIVAPSADLALALRAIAFAAMGTAGQRCMQCPSAAHRTGRAGPGDPVAGPDELPYKHPGAGGDHPGRRPEIRHLAVVGKATPRGDVDRAGHAEFNKPGRRWQRREKLGKAGCGSQFDGALPQ